ncbi:hypothetical protein [Jatrophihabitans sp.]|jgi:hypothetical protein|uniref:hypothetical protein n=1 Tax=Jatrophihabitans sp. TaxID=1932789 RepID=UPI002F00385D
MSDTEDASGTAAGTSGTVMNRRALLRASGVAAGIAGIGGLAAAQATAADAAAGDPLRIGRINDGGTSPSTTLVSAENGPTMILVMDGTGPTLRVLPRESTEPLSVGSGDLINVDGDLRFAHRDGGAWSIFNSYNATVLVPVRPTRIVDTRTAAGRANLIDPWQHIDTEGRLMGGHTIDINLTRHVFRGTAVFANLTVTDPLADGYLTLWPMETRPGTSMLNYLAGQTVANFTVTGLNSDTMRLYTQRTTHVLLDVVAFAVGRASDINNTLLTGN